MTRPGSNEAAGAQGDQTRRNATGPGTGPPSKAKGNWVDTPARVAARQKGRPQPGEKRRRSYAEDVPHVRETLERLLEEHARLFPGDMGSLERVYAEQAAVALYDRDEALAWRRNNSRSSSPQAWKRIELIGKLGDQITRCHEGLVRAGQERVQRERVGKAHDVPRSEERALALAEILGRQGAIPMIPGLRAALNKQQELERRDADLDRRLKAQKGEVDA